MKSSPTKPQTTLRKPPTTSSSCHAHVTLSHSRPLTRRHLIAPRLRPVRHLGIHMAPTPVRHVSSPYPTPPADVSMTSFKKFFAPRPKMHILAKIHDFCMFCIVFRSTSCMKNMTSAAANLQKTDSKALPPPYLVQLPSTVAS